ncbi:MAG: RNA polymerase subunit sigma-70 [Salinibacterium sp.]|nr:RNA polymerase subunit sigma-70 [Salinibacterium sp.]
MAASGAGLGPDDAFAAVISLRRRANQLERQAVDLALEEKWTWAQIGQALGMTAQAAHKRLAPARRTELR